MTVFRAVFCSLNNQVAFRRKPYQSINVTVGIITFKMAMLQYRECGIAKHLRKGLLIGFQ